MKHTLQQALALALISSLFTNSTDAAFLRWSPTRIHAVSAQETLFSQQALALKAEQNIRSIPGASQDRASIMRLEDAQRQGLDQPSTAGGAAFVYLQVHRGNYFSVQELAEAIKRTSTSVMQGLKKMVREAPNDLETLLVRRKSRLGNRRIIKFRFKPEAMDEAEFHWEGLPLREIGESPLFYRHATGDMLETIFGDQLNAELARFRFHNLDLRSMPDLRMMLKDAFADELLGVFQDMWNDRASDGWDAETLFRKNNVRLVEIRDTAILNEGLKWLAIQGFPLQFFGGRWHIRPVHPGRSLGMDADPAWSTEIKKAWNKVRAKKLDADPAGPQVYKRIMILREAYPDLTWDEIGVGERVAQFWSKGQKPEFETLSRIAAHLDIDTTWLTHGYSRAEYEELLRSELSDNPARNLKLLRFAAGFSIHELTQRMDLRADSIVREVESGEMKNPRIPSFWKDAAQKLAVSPWLLLTGSNTHDALYRLPFGRRIELALRVKGETRENLARAAKVSNVVVVDRWITSTDRPLRETQDKIAQFVGLERDELFTPQGPLKKKIAMHHDDRTALDYLWPTARAREEALSHYVQGGLIKDPFRLTDELEAAVAIDLETVYGRLLENRRSYTIQQLFDELQERPGLLALHSVEDLEHGLKWLEITGYPLLRSGDLKLGDRWRVNGIVRNKFFLMTLELWPEDLANDWRALRKKETELSGPDVATRIRILLKVYDFLTLDDFGVSSKAVEDWSKGRRPLEHIVEEMGHRLGLEPVWLMTGYSRYEFEEIAYQHLRPESPGQNIRWLRWAAGLSASTLDWVIQEQERTVRRLESYTRVAQNEPRVWRKLGIALGQSTFRVYTGFEINGLGLGERIELLLRIRGKSRQDLARAMRIPVAWIHAWIDGTNPRIKAPKRHVEVYLPAIAVFAQVPYVLAFPFVKKHRTRWAGDVQSRKSRLARKSA